MPRYSEEVKEQARELRAQGLTYVQIAAEVGAGKETVRCWLDQSAAVKQSARHKSWREANHAYYTKQKREYYKANKRVLNAKAKAQYRLKRSQILAKNKKYRQANMLKYKATQKRWRLDNKARIKVLNKRYYQAHREAYIMRARQRECAITAWPVTDIEKLMIVYKYEEAKRLTFVTEIQHEVDHVWPVSKGGPHLPWNLRVLPKQGNRAKSNHVGDDW